MFFQIFQYLKFQLTARNQHGVHSPFVYQIVTKGFYSKGNKTAQNKYQTISKNLALNKKLKASRISIKKPKLMLKVIAYFMPENNLEIGTSFGLGTTLIKIGNPNASVTTLENLNDTLVHSKKICEKNKFENTTFVQGDFSQTIPDSSKNKKFDWIHLHGEYSKEEVINYFEACLFSTHNETLFVFDSIHKSKEMSTAWSVIKQHPKVTVTIDVFYYGFVFFRKEQEKEHFKIRI